MSTSSKHELTESKMLAYSKIILEKMSFSSRLVRKEYRKCLKWLQPADGIRLKEWVRAKIKTRTTSYPSQKRNQINASKSIPI